MNRALVDQIAAAVLYEGYMLYPYRPSVKNRQRWTFGGLYPEAYCRSRENGDASSMRTECLVLGGSETAVQISVRFLQLVNRLVAERPSRQGEWSEASHAGWNRVESLTVGDVVHHPWQEAVEHKLDLCEPTPGTLIAEPKRIGFHVESGRQTEPLRDPDGVIVGAFIRERRRIEGMVEISAAAVAEGTFRLSVTVSNETQFASEDEFNDRDEGLMHSLVSTHTVLEIRGGEFVSMIDPPESLRRVASECRNTGTWPVLVGQDGEKRTMLSAPIILYDYPQIAPESAGDLFDSTEIDEILTLRIMTLTEEEKRAMSAVDRRARALLERTEALTHDQLFGFHGTIRGLRLSTEEKGARR